MRKTIVRYEPMPSLTEYRMQREQLTETEIMIHLTCNCNREYHLLVDSNGPATIVENTSPKLDHYDTTASLVNVMQDAAGSVLDASEIEVSE